MLASPIFILDQAPLAIVSMPKRWLHPFEARIERKSKRKAGVGVGVAVLVREVNRGQM
jgi:hypothetical protein